MSYVSKLIYREINNLIPDLKKIKPSERINLSNYGFKNIFLKVLENTSEEMSIEISYYSLRNSVLVANPSFEILIYCKMHIAEVVSYNDPSFTYKLIHENEGIGIDANSYANKLVYEWLKELKLWNSNKKDSFNKHK